MIQDIAPSKLDNRFRKCEPKAKDPVLVFDPEGRILADTRSGELRFTGLSVAGEDIRFLFSVDDRNYFLSMKPAGSVPAGYEYMSIRQIRDTCGGKELFAAFTAYHLWKWYDASRYCGCCGALMAPDEKERAMRCACGNIVYPRINPAVIVGVTNGDSLLITRYRKGYAHNALVAGFSEIGETFEETVAREVMEEAGIEVTNIRYYKSQPWGMAQDMLAGFYCDVAGDDTIKMDDDELKYAAWTKREDIELQPNNLSLTNEMMRMFKEKRI